MKTFKNKSKVEIGKPSTRKRTIASYSSRVLSLFLIVEAYEKYVFLRKKNFVMKKVKSLLFLKML